MKVELTGQSTSDLETLSHDATLELIRRAQAGDEEAKKLVVEGNLKLVLHTVQRFKHRSDDMDDLFQIGCVGLIKAIERFDLTRGVRFSTYAVPMIIGEIRRYLRDSRPVHVSRRHLDLYRRAGMIRERLTQELGREPSVGEIAGALDVPREDLVMAYAALQDPASLSDPIQEGEDNPIRLEDKLSDDDVGEEKWTDQAELFIAMQHLTERERTILFRRYFADQTQMEIAEDIGLSQAQVSRLERRALDQLQGAMASET